MTDLWKHGKNAIPDKQQNQTLSSFNEQPKKESVWGAKLMFGGYAGLKHTADKINDYIPTSQIYCEPFAGLGRTVHLRHKKIVLNDMSDYAVNYLKEQYDEYEWSYQYPIQVTQKDFMDCILENDSAQTFFLIDPPWRFTCYDSHHNAFCDRKPIEYYQQVLDVLPKLDGDWIICSNVDEHEIKKILSKTAKQRGYYSKIVQSDKKVIFGKYARTLIVSNKPLEIQLND